MSASVVAVCTCQKDGSSWCKYPHPCRRCYSFHPGISCYWHGQGKTSIVGVRAVEPLKDQMDHVGCDECCNGDRCDDRTHFDRDSCRKRH
jgi:hypothetical protein